MYWHKDRQQGRHARSAVGVNGKSYIRVYIHMYLQIIFWKIYTCTYIWIHAHPSKHECLHEFLYTYINIYTRIRKNTSSHMWCGVDSNSFIHFCVRMHVCIYHIFTCVFMFVYTFTHKTHTQRTYLCVNVNIAWNMYMFHISDATHSPIHTYVAHDASDMNHSSIYTYDINMTHSHLWDLSHSYVENIK